MAATSPQLPPIEVLIFDLECVSTARLVCCPALSATRKHASHCPTTLPPPPPSGVLADLCELHRDLFLESFNQLASQEGAAAPLLSKEVHNELLEGLSTRSKLRACRGIFPAAAYDEDAVYELKQRLTMERLAEHHFPARTLQALTWARAAGLRLACYTNSIRATLDLVLQRLGVAGLFEATQSNEEVPASKPSPVGYTQLMARLGVAPDRVLIFEDSPPGLAAARGSGATVIQVLDSLDITPQFLQHAVAARAPYAPTKLHLVVPMAGLDAAFAAEGYTLPKPFLPTHQERPESALWRIVIDNVMPKQEPLRSATEVHLVVREEMEAAIRAAAPPGVHVHLAPPLSEGQACTVLSLRAIINCDTPLFICNADQILGWDADAIYRAAFHPSYDGAVVAFYHPAPNDLRWSYASLAEDGTLAHVAEKRYVGPWATTGHYAWRRGSDYVAAAEALIAEDARVGNAFYVAPAYAAGRARGARYRVVPCDGFWGLGTPGDYCAFLERYTAPGSSGASWQERLAARYARAWCKHSHRLPAPTPAPALLQKEDVGIAAALWGSAAGGSASAGAAGASLYAFTPALEALRRALKPWWHKAEFALGSGAALGGESRLVLHAMRAPSSAAVVALQAGAWEAGMAAWAGAARREMARLPPLSMALRGALPVRRGVALAGYPSADWGSVRAALAAAAPCSPPSGDEGLHLVPLLYWTEALTAEELAGVVGVLQRFAGADFGVAEPGQWHVGYVGHPSFQPPATRAVASWAAGAPPDSPPRASSGAEGK